MASKTYSSNKEVQATIEALLKIGCPPIPVAPKQDPRGEWCHVRTKTKEGHLYCPLDKNLNPIARFGGKNPSYLDGNGSPRYVKHGEFQNKLPTESELKKFFRNPKTGVGTLGGHAGVDWLDFDAKCYPSQSDCDNDVDRIISNICSHTGVQEDDLWIERTGSGGWRVAVKPIKKPTFTNFATVPDGEHVGEALYKGRFTVLAPTIHPNGNPYHRIGWGNPVEVESLEAIGIYPTLSEVETIKKRKKREKKTSHTNPTQPTNPQDNPWDIRNFAHYFEGYHEKSDGWGYAKCPHHNGTSQTSFRVNLSMGHFKAWCNCNTKDVYKSGLELAQRLGYKTREKQDSVSEGSPIQEPDPEEYRQYEEYLRLEEEYAIADEARRKREWAEEQMSARYRNWAGKKRFTPHITSNAEYCDFEIPEPGTITIIKAALGAGKSTQLAWIISELKRLNRVPCFINLGYRNSLLHQFNKLTGFHHIQDGTEALMLLRANEGYGISLCVDSILKLRPEHYEGATVLLDEFTSVIRHIIKSKTISESIRKKVLERFADCLNMAERVICLDALASDFFADYLHQLCPTKKIVRWENTYERPKPKIYLYEGSISDVGSLKPSDKSPLYRRMLVQIAKGNRIVIGVDSQNKGEAIDKFLTDIFPSKKGIRIDSKTVAEKGATEEFLHNASRYLQTNDVSWVIFTSSAESGIDINVPGYFSEFYGIFEGVLAVDSIIQMLGRLRDWNVPRYIYVANKMLPGNRGDFPQSAEELLRRQLEKIAHGIDSSNPYSGESLPAFVNISVAEIIKTPHDVMAWLLSSLQSYEADNLRNCVQERLEQLGFGVKVIVEDEDNDNRRAIKEASEEIKLEEATDIHRAEKVDELPEKSWNATWDDRAVEINYFLRKRLPGIDQTPLWNPEGIKFLRSDEPEFIRRLERWMKLKYPHLCNRLLREKIANLIRFPTGILSNWKDESLMIDTLRECGLLEILESGKEYTNDSPEIMDFIRKISNWKNKRAIGKSQGKDSPIKFVNRLAKLFGLKFVQTRRSTDNKRYYSVDERITENPRRLTVLNCLETRWRDILTGEKEEIDYTKILVPDTEFVSPGALEDEIALTLTYCDCESDMAKMMEPIKGSLRKIAATVRNAASTFRRNLPDVPEDWVNHWLNTLASYLRSLELPPICSKPDGVMIKANLQVYPGFI